jgi:NADH:ubiquinone oxidoreductase subunit 5 (subunit L)/multisubunit Na+/H+ antiporter MnhA subunit
MTAPTPVSALMHAGLVNAGGFLLIRFAPVLEAAPVARLVAVALGLAAVVLGLGVMLVRPDVKRALAGSTISQMGFMIMSCGLGAYAAALWHVIAHGLFKAWLFLGSGSAIGMGKAPADRVMTRSIPVIAGVVLAVALVLTWAGRMNGAHVPLLLALATGAVTLGAGLGSAMPTRARWAAVALLIGIGTSDLAGLWLADITVGHDGPRLIGGWMLTGLLAAFLGGWAWQARRPSLHPRLYVHLLNAGALRGAFHGDA